jgi:single-strand DNA-binding protein
MSEQQDDQNEVHLRGNLGADPELRMTGGGTAVLKLRIATNESFLDKNKQQQKRTSWHRVVVWGKQAEELGRNLSKGSRVYVEGRLNTSSYENKEGLKVWTTEVVARKVESIGLPRGGADDSRRGDAGVGGEYPSRGRAPVEHDADSNLGYADDDIPF